MGDRCFMTVTCRREDRKRFEELGFVLEFDEGSDPVIEMIDEQANFAHDDKLPRDIPYTAYHAAGDNYGEGEIACDAQHYTEVNTSESGFVVQWNHQANQPTQESLQHIRQFLRVKGRVDALFKTIEGK